MTYQQTKALLNKKRLSYYKASHNKDKATASVLKQEIWKLQRKLLSY